MTQKEIREVLKDPIVETIIQEAPILQEVQEATTQEVLQVEAVTQEVPPQEEVDLQDQVLEEDKSDK